MRTMSVVALKNLYGAKGIPCHREKIKKRGILFDQSDKKGILYT
jgi:hypothetical protein